MVTRERFDGGILDVSNIVYVCHQDVMIQAKASRREEEGEDVGIKFRWVPGSSFSRGKSWEKGSSEAKEVVVRSALLPEDTIKRERGWKIGRSNEGKEEKLEFGIGEGGKIKILDSWVDTDEDVRQRVRRAGAIFGYSKCRFEGAEVE